jgi:hypothetical protein
LQASLLTMTKRLTSEKSAIVPVVAMADMIRLIPGRIEIAYFQIDAQGHDLKVGLSAFRWRWQYALAS